MKAVAAAQPIGFGMKHPTAFTLLLLPLLACDPQESPDYEGEPVATVRGSVSLGGESPEAAEAAILWYTSEEECQGPALACGYSFSSTDTETFACVEACGEPACDPDSLDGWAACAEACGGGEIETESEFEGCVNGGVGESVAISVETFPADFELSLYDGPPPETLLRGSDNGPRVAMGVFVALSPEAPSTFDFFADDAPLHTILGGVSSHALIYAMDPVSADSGWGRYLGGSYEPGYHLVRYEVEIDCEDLPGECVIADETRSPEPGGFDVELELEFGPLSELYLPL